MWSFYVSRVRYPDPEGVADQAGADALDDGGHGEEHRGAEQSETRFWWAD